ncbi:transcription factor E2F6 [Pholidichthys leucotaenia]
MVKCVVSGCPNRSAAFSLGLTSGPPKRFFKFPKDPERVQVWLAALRQTEKKDAIKKSMICEDHFLPEDISTVGISKDAIPIMPPCMGGALTLLGDWEEDSDEEGDHWAFQEEEEEEEEDEGGEEREVPVTTTDAPMEGSECTESRNNPRRNLSSLTQRHGSTQYKCSLARSRERGGKMAPESNTESVTPKDSKETTQMKFVSRGELSLAILTQRFLEQLLLSPDHTVDVGEVAKRLNTRRRRVYDITNVLQGINLVDKESASKFKWIGSAPISSFIAKSRVKSQCEVENLKLVEDTLDVLIKGCARRLFDLTDNQHNALMAYVTHEDIRRLKAFEDQTVIVIKAPEETKLEVPPPTEHSIQIHLKEAPAPVTVTTCDFGTEDDGGNFIMLEESRIKTSELQTVNNEWWSPKGGAQTT